MKKITFILLYYLIFIIGCEDSNKNDNTDNNITEVVTSNIYVSSFYYNLVSKSEVASDEIWHFSAQLKDVFYDSNTYKMPNIILGNIYAMLSENSFKETTVPPSENSAWYLDNSVVEYGGIDEIINYNMITHVASIENPKNTFIIYETNGHTTYKVQFLEYASGIVSLQFSPL